MKKFLYLLFSLALLSASLKGQQSDVLVLNSPVSSGEYEEGTIVIKLKSVPNSTSQGANQRREIRSGELGLDVIEKELTALKLKSFTKPFPNEKKPLSSKTSSHQVDLSNIYIIKISPDENLETAINSLRKNENVEYAEPYYNHKLFLIPNDPKANPTSGIQYQLNLINAYNAWNIQRGDSNTIIGIIDTGVLFNHQDLKGNIKYNYADPINNIDDDNDGYVDNFRGWDFADRDNDATADGSGHGTEVAGCSNGHANNGLGIAGTSYNSKFLPLKVFRTSTDRFWMGFEAIKYAADHGCKVINISWGGESFSKFEQNIIDYAVLEKDVVIIAAAGNTYDDKNLYPASYNNVLSVGATNRLDQKADFSTYNTAVDISAPGEAVGTSQNADSAKYGTTSGTSFSAPIVAGAAALVRARFPHYNALQVMEQLRVTSDDIYSDPVNAPFKEKLGKGRLNMYQALMDTSVSSVRMVSYSIDNGGRDLAFYDDTIKVSCEFKNYLSPSSNLKITLSSPSPYVTILNETFVAGSFSTLQSKHNADVPFQIYLSPDTPPSHKLTFRLGFEDGNYNDYQYFDIYTAPDYLDVEFNDLLLTTTGKGRLAFRDNSETGEQRLLGSGGIMLATSSSKVSHNVVSNLSTGQSDQNLTQTRGIKYFKNSFAGLETRGTLVDTINNTNQIGLIVSQKEYGWQNTPDRSFIILEYFITNNSGVTIPSLYSGFFADWNIDSYNKNRAEWNAENNFGYVYSSASGKKMTAIALLTTGTPIYYALDHRIDNGNGIILSDGFTKREKFSALSSELLNNQAGMDGEGSDVSHIVGVKLDNVANKTSVKVAYAVVMGNSLEELKSAVVRAREKFNEYQLNPPTSISIPFCSNFPATVKTPDNKKFSLYDSLPLGTPIFTGNEYTTPELHESTSYYITQYNEGFESEPSKVVLYKNDIQGDFTMDLDTLDLIKGNKVSFTGNSLNAVKWHWTFDNGYQSTNRNTVKVFNKQGTYKIKLMVENSSGCSDTINKTLVVISSSPKPEVSPVYVCKGGDGEIMPENGTNFNFYKSFPISTPIFTGRSFVVSDVDSTTTYWVTNIDSLYESEPLEVKVKVWDKFADFTLQMDTLNLDESSTLEVADQTEGSVAWTWECNGKTIEGINKTGFSFSKTGVYSITLKVFNFSGGCVDTKSKQVVVVRKTPTPASRILEICRNESLEVAFDSGNNLRFYSSYPDKIICEGNTLKTASIAGDQVIFVTSSDSLLESDPAEVMIKVTDVNADFTLSKDSIFLDDNSVQLTSTSEAAVKWDWDFGNGETDTTSSPEISYNIPGIYTISLTTQNKNGCKATVIKEVVVMDAEAENRNVSVYPNPTKDVITVKSSFAENATVDVKLLNSRGEEVKAFINHGNDFVSFNMANYPKGLYIVKIQNGNESETIKVLLTE